MKRPLLLLLVALLISSASAYNFGTLTYQTSKNAVDRNVSFQIGVINPESSDLTVELSSRGLENGRTVFPENKFTLKPTKVTKNPKGDGWISVAPGKYAKVRKIDFWVIMNEKVNESFQVRIRSQKSKPESSGIRPKTVQLRDYGYSIEYPEKEANAVSRGYEREEGSDNGLEIIKPKNDEGSDTSATNNDKTAVENSSTKNASKTSKTNETSTSKEGKGVNSMTLALSVGAAASLIYLWMVI